MKKTVLISAAYLAFLGLVLPAQARTDGVSAFERYRARVLEINSRQNKRAEALGSQFEEKLTDFYLGKAKYPSDLSRQFSRIEAERSSELRRAQNDLASTRLKLNGEPGEKKEQSLNSRRPSAVAPSVHGVSSVPERESIVLDGSGIQKEVDFHAAGAATGAPADGGAGVQEIQFGR